MQFHNKDEITSYFYVQSKIIKFEKPKSAFLYYKNSRIDLLKNVRENFSLEMLQQKLNAIKINDKHETPYVLHLFYELGFYFKELDKLINDNDVLAIEIEYQESSELRPIKCDVVLKNKLQYKIPYEEYQTGFKKCYDKLIDGDCYQLNYTGQFKYQIDSNNSDFELFNYFINKGRISGYAHMTSIPLLDKIYFSNSPECLFKINKYSDHFKISSMPIKGTLEFDPQKEKFEDKWAELISCEKNQSELYMISDMVRNDLCAIEMPNAQVLKKKIPLAVPGLIHQYSLIEASLSYNVSLGKILKEIYPGASITGAPKKNVLKILKGIEDNKRGFYTGSTIVLHKSLLSASINIRTAVIDLSKNILSYGAGGGLTLLSTCNNEYDEMVAKVMSFLDTFR